jgi:hypothetical protein
MEAVLFASLMPRRSTNGIEDIMKHSILAIGLAAAMNAQVGGGQTARFRFARGNARFDIRCPANEQLRDCLQAASQFVRQMSQMPDPDEKGAGSESGATGTKQ